MHALIHRIQAPSRCIRMACSAAAPQNCRIGVAQLNSVASHDENFAHVERMARECAAAGCKALFLPEVFAFLGKSQQESLSAAQPLNGPVMERYRTLARSTGLWMSLGGFQEASPFPDRMHNTHVIICPEGKTRAAYRKVHLFDVDVPSGPLLMESRATAPGNELVTCPGTPLGTLGLSVCYDLRFPEVYQALAHDMGADVLLVPSAFTVPTGRAHWEVLLRARAIETQTWVVAAAQTGRHNEKRESYGHSMVVSPWGDVVLDVDPAFVGVSICDIDLGSAARVRERMPCKEHRDRGRAAIRNWPGCEGLGPRGA